MRKRQKSSMLCLAVATGFLFTLLNSSSPAQVVIIVNKSVPITSVGVSTVLDIYSLSMKEWPDGARITVVTMKSNESSNQFYQYIGKRSLDMKKLWMRAQLSGEGRPPVALNSDEEVVEKVASTPGAIGFVRKLNAGTNVKIVAIIE